MALPLDGITVVACEQAVAGPLSTRHLADLGARVIKIERPAGGDFARGYDTTVLGQSSHFVWLNRGKQSVVVDLTEPGSGAIMDALVAQADVFVQNLVPGAAERRGLGAARLRDLNPRLVHCSISGYGADGPLRDAKAYDLLIQSEAGLVDVTGTPEQRAKAGIPAADIAAGMYAFSHILAALYERDHTGTGATIEVSLFDSLVEWMGFPLYYTEYGGSAPVRSGTSHASIAPYGSYASSDGSSVVLAIQNEREWERFCRMVVERPGLLDDERLATSTSRAAHRTLLDEVIVGVLSALPVDEIERRLDVASIAHARQRGVAEVFHHPQIAGRDRLVEIHTPAGQIEAFKPPVVWPGRELAMGAVPALGEHTEAVLAELVARPPR